MEIQEGCRCSQMFLLWIKKRRLKSNRREEPAFERRKPSAPRRFFSFLPPGRSYRLSQKSRADNIRGFPPCYRLCVLASGSLIMDIFSCRTVTNVSRLHFGQYSGKFSRTVSSLNLIRVLFPHNGHKAHSKNKSTKKPISSNNILTRKFNISFPFLRSYFSRPTNYFGGIASPHNFIRCINCRHTIKAKILLGSSFYLPWVLFRHIATFRWENMKYTM